MIWRKRMVRVHFLGRDESVEGILVGRGAGHYRLAKAALLSAPGETRPLDGEVWVPASRVLFLQVTS